MNYQLRRGLTLKLAGTPGGATFDGKQPASFAIKPGDIPGIEAIPHVLVGPGDSVLAGQPLVRVKAQPEVQLSSPVSGRVYEIRRGPKRAVEEIVIEADREIQFVEFRKPDLASRDEIVRLLLESGAWGLIRQRPFNVFANPGVVPRDIFVSCFDTAPLAPDPEIVMQGREGAFAEGLAALACLTEGRVHLGVRAGSKTVAVDLSASLPKIAIHQFDGPHPAGNVGVQIHHVAPLSKGQIVWTIKPQDVAIIGSLVSRGVFDARRTIAITGSNLQRTGYVQTRLGAAVAPWVENNLKAEPARLVSGNVLSGKQIALASHLGFYDDQLTVIAEGDQPEFLGWLLPSYPRPTMSRTFLSYYAKDREFDVTSSQHGKKRAFVMTGEYERVVPMDVLPQHLLKAILGRDFERAEGLGIYEVVEEDFSLCEFVCTSKQPVQRILREGLDWIRSEA